MSRRGWAILALLTLLGVASPPLAQSLSRSDTTEAYWLAREGQLGPERSTPGRDQLLGLACLLTGAGCGWLAAAVQSMRRARRAARQTAEPLRRALLALAENWEPADAASAPLRELAGSLAVAQLDQAHLLPSWRHPWFAAGREAALQDRFDRASQRLAIASLVSSLGWPVLAAGPEGAALDAARAELANTATEAPDLPRARAELAGILTRYYAARGAELPPAVLAGPASRAPVEVRGGFARLHHGMWAAWAALSVAVGWLVLLGDHSLAAASGDLFLCLLWGAVLPTALHRLAPSSQPAGWRAVLPGPAAPAAGLRPDAPPLGAALRGVPPGRSAY